MLQFDGLGFLFQGANLKIHTDGTNVTLLEVPRVGSPEDEEKWHPKVWEKKPKEG